MKTCVLRHHQLGQAKPVFRSAISLHSHTHHSKESLEYLPLQAVKIPLVAAIVDRELRAYAQRNGRSVDFRRAWWTPPMSPEQVYQSECQQIRGLGLIPLVSITDHDAIDAGLTLQQQPSAWSVPVSVEWTVPVAGDAVHLGVHNLPYKQAPAIMAELARYTAQPTVADLRDLLALLASFPQSLIVLNHPCWDIARVGAAHHAAALRDFFALTEHWIHALEVNGMRSTTENAAALQMANDLGLPTVAGGDRHGSRPNTVLNVSQASCFDGFVDEVRNDRRSIIVSMPSYQESLGLRQLQTAADAVRRYPRHPHGRRSFTSRTFIDLDGLGGKPVSYFWDEGPPLWLRPVLGVIAALGSDHAKPLLHSTVFRQKERDLMVLASSTLSLNAGVADTAISTNDGHRSKAFAPGTHKSKTGSAT